MTEPTVCANCGKNPPHYFTPQAQAEQLVATWHKTAWSDVLSSSVRDPQNALTWQRRERHLVEQIATALTAAQAAGKREGLEQAADFHKHNRERLERECADDEAAKWQLTTHQTFCLHTSCEQEFRRRLLELCVKNDARGVSASAKLNRIIGAIRER